MVTFVRHRTVIENGHDLGSGGRGTIVNEESRAALALLETGNMEVLGLLPYSSNYVFLARVRGESRETLAVYKPRRGERPLWDFPHGSLAAREVAAYLVAEAAGWHLVPPTVLRADAPLGPGSLQQFIEHDPDRHYLVLVEERASDFPVFAAFDVAINNGDRKAGHVLEDDRGRLWAVDHGVSFHTHPKLRTVIWAFGGMEIGDEVRAGLERLGVALCGGPLEGDLQGLISSAEVAATAARVERLLSSGEFPSPETDHHLPWPLI
jgi:hypothetical protein